MVCLDQTYRRIQTRTNLAPRSLPPTPPSSMPRAGGDPTWQFQVVKARGAFGSRDLRAVSVRRLLVSFGSFGFLLGFLGPVVTIRKLRELDSGAFGAFGKGNISAACTPPCGFYGSREHFTFICPLEKQLSFHINKHIVQVIYLSVGHHFMK